MSIPLPPLPRHDKVYSNRWGDGSDATYWYSPETLRARDLEVARVVLEAAANVCRDFAATDSLSNYGLVMARLIDELEFKHHD